ncbi:substrate-binding periplasmic protein [Chromobacterium piscinae]|uniref:Transporter substrate-binding domain-containing protein n=1 Tax=Chromobacterium piscinae TaxID=686831 RepID=A0ABV0H8V9_9NEIS|nr:transporter substrate-binding domain-containing protein [Chromobacterium piscinae]MBX9296676.1 transporter substrate-binding domain-containing protein [Chromobacterium vaccinii]MBX9348072.1 transporter substrate-binding domain-containing protein [Chromobacterium vaccinii]MBX9356808.1 transporter substrate-binding domain-containing protein [Chromobacterium vaccinii]MCD4503742.1 transporter substrate-binding domain-containing protein [Chromobacterium piscinae]MCD5329044.1 transporter substrat
MRYHGLALGILSWAALLAAPVEAAQRLKITLSNQEWPPYMGQELPYDGILSRLVKEAFARGGVDVAFRYYPNNRTLQSARNGQVDGSFGWAPTAERKRDLLYTLPVLSARMVFYQRKSHKLDWSRWAELKGARVGVTVGNYYSDDFDAQAKNGILAVDSAPDDLVNLRKLLAGRIDLFPIDLEVGRYLIAHHFPPAQGGQLEAQNRSFWSAPLHVVIWRKHAQGKELVERFNRGLKVLQDSGDFDRLLQETREACLQPRAYSP